MNARGRLAWVTDGLLFLSSFALLFIALAMRFESPAWLRLACIGLAVAGLASGGFILSMQHLLSREYVTIESIDDRGSDVGGYLATYLLPLVVISSPSRWDIAAYVLVMFVIGVVYVRSRLVGVNPTLYLVGYRLFFVRTTEGFAGYLLSREEPAAGKRLRVVRRDNVLIEVKG